MLNLELIGTGPVDTGLYALQLFAELAVLFVLISFLVEALQQWLPADKTRR